MRSVEDSSETFTRLYHDSLETFSRLFSMISLRVSYDIYRQSLYYDYSAGHKESEKYDKY
jgi:hypothetical protein